MRGLQKRASLGRAERSHLVGGSILSRRTDCLPLGQQLTTQKHTWCSLLSEEFIFFKNCNHSKTVFFPDIEDCVYVCKGVQEQKKRMRERERETVREREMALPMVCHNLASSGRQKDRQRSLLPADGYRVHDQRGIQRCRLHTDQSVLNIPLRERHRDTEAISKTIRYHLEAVLIDS